MSAEFASDLFAAACERDIASNPFVRGIRDGLFPKSALRPYATDIAALATGFPRVIASILARCDDERVWRVMLENLLEEEGAVSFGAGNGLVVDPDRRHSVLALRFARAAGAAEEDVRRHSADSTNWFARELRHGRWLGPLAYISVGVEANVPPAFRVITDGLREHYGFTDENLGFLTEHFIADERHGEAGAKIVAAAATTSAARSEALEGARRGAMGWWQLHRKHAGALRPPGRA